MLANEGSGTSGGRGQPQINSKATFVFSTWLIMFAAFLRKFPLVFRAYQMEVPKKKTADQEIAQRSFLLMKERFVDDEYEDIEAISRQCAEINPYAKRLMLEIERDPEYMASIEHPEYTFKEDLSKLLGERNAEALKIRS